MIKIEEYPHELFEVDAESCW